LGEAGFKALVHEVDPRLERRPYLTQKFELLSRINNEQRQQFERSVAAEMIEVDMDSRFRFSFKAMVSIFLNISVVRWCAARA
jgi:hypothetical protein